MVNVIRVHHYHVDSADLEEFIANRTTLIESVRSVHSGLTGTKLIRNEDGSYTDMWQWENIQALVAALPVAHSAEAAAAMKFTREATASNAEIIDQR